MKAILLVDMPSSCDVCDFLEVRERCAYCGVPGYGNHVEDYVACRPDFCPLKPVPERAYHRDFCDVGRYDKGWNECIDEI